MSKNKEEVPERSELRIEGFLSEKGVIIRNKAEADALRTRGYGVIDGKQLCLTFYEALYLVDKGNLIVNDEKVRKVDFRNLLKCFEEVSENAWVQYLVYRDLRSRGYVLREGFGSGVDFRVYERGDYSKETAKYLVLSIQEGKPVSMMDLTNALLQTQSLKKELILAVMNRRGEIVYYTVGQLTLK
jgi:tRNA-intron endonuclease